MFQYWGPHDIYVSSTYVKKRIKRDLSVLIVANCREKAKITAFSAHAASGYLTVIGHVIFEVFLRLYVRIVNEM